LTEDFYSLNKLHVGTWPIDVLSHTGTSKQATKEKHVTTRLMVWGYSHDDVGIRDGFADGFVWQNFTTVDVKLVTDVDVLSQH